MFCGQREKSFFISCGYLTLGSGHLLSFHSIRLHNYCVSCVIRCFHFCRIILVPVVCGVDWPSWPRCFIFSSVLEVRVIVFFLRVTILELSIPRYVFQLISTLHHRCFLISLWRVAAALQSFILFDSLVHFGSGERVPYTNAINSRVPRYYTPTHRTPTHLCARPWTTLTFIIAAVPRCKQTHKVRRHRPRLQHRLTVYDKDLLTQSERYCVSPCRPLHHPNMLPITPQILKLCIHRL